MTLKGKFDRTYTVNTSLPKTTIVNTFKERIEEASKDKSWFTFNDINYKKIKADDTRAVIRLDPVFFGQLGGIGVAMLHFEADNGFTKIQAVVKPFVNGLWFLLALMTLFSALFVWFIPGTDKFLFTIAAWILMLTPAYIGIVFRRYRLTKYLKTVLSDVGVQEELMKG